MEKAELIPAKDFCIHHSVSYTFFSGLHEAGLVQTVIIEEEQYIHPDCIGSLEKLARLHSDLGINIEGIEAIAQLLQQVDALQMQVQDISRRLQRYENI